MGNQLGGVERCRRPDMSGLFLAVRLSWILKSLAERPLLASVFVCRSLGRSGAVIWHPVHGEQSRFCLRQRKPLRHQGEYDRSSIFYARIRRVSCGA